MQRLSDDRDAVLLAFVGSYNPKKYSPGRSGSATINIVDEFGIEDALSDICNRTESTARKAYLLINSVGGGVASSFKIAQAIRDAFEEITVFVPHIAASGGTMLALTGNRIRMGMMSQLSPVDPQRPYKNEGLVSVNSIARAKKRLDKKFEKRQEGEMGYPDRHMAELIDPVMYEEFFGLREANMKYLGTILEKSGYDKERIGQITDELLFGLPTHGFVIDRNLVKEIGLRIEPDDTDMEEWNLMRHWFAKYVGREADRHFVRYCVPRPDKAK